MRGTPQHPEVAAFMRATFADEYGVVPKGLKGDIAHQLGVASATVSRWFSGSITISPERWPDLARIAGVTRDDVAAALGDGPPPGLETSGELAALIVGLADAASKERKAVAESIRAR